MEFLVVFRLVVLPVLISLIMPVKSGYPYDVICNNQTEFTCLCYHGDGKLRPYFPECNSFISSDSLTVTVITAQQLDITDYQDGQLMEDYFKKEIVQIVSEPCEKFANNCRGTALPIHPESVVVLSVTCGANDTTSVALAITNSRDIKLLSPETTLDASIVISAINESPAKLKSLEKALIPAIITDISNDTIIIIPDDYTGDPWADNFSTIMVLLGIAVVLVFMYIIAIGKVIRDVYVRRKRKVAMQQRVANDHKPSASYGATSNSVSMSTKPVSRPDDIQNSIKPTENGRKNSIPKRISSSSLSKGFKGGIEPLKEAREPSETSPLLHNAEPTVVPPNKPSRSAPRLPEKIWTPPSPSAELLFFPSLMIKKAASTHSITRIEEENGDETATEYASTNPPRSATFHDSPLDRDKTEDTKANSENSSEEDEEPMGSEEENSSNYKELAGSVRSLNQKIQSSVDPFDAKLPYDSWNDFSQMNHNHPDILVHSPLQSPQWKQNNSDNFDALSAPTVPQEYRVSQEFLLNQDADISDQDSDASRKNIRRKKGAKKKKPPTREFSSELSSEESVEEEGESSESTGNEESGLGAPEYERLAESNLSINRISDNEELLDLR